MKRIKGMRTIKRFDGRIEKEIWWERKVSEKQIVKLVREAAIRLEWDPDIIEDLFQEKWDGFNSSYNDKDYLFGFDIDYDPVSRQVRIYMFAEVA